MEYMRDAILVLIMTSAPLMGIGLAVGLVVALFQTVTQIQEMTLAFVPKILAVFVSMILLMPYMLAVLSDFMQRVALRIATLE